VELEEEINSTSELDSAMEVDAAKLAGEVRTKEDEWKTQATALQDIEGWEHLSETKRRFLHERPRWKSRTQTARKIGTSPAYMLKEMYTDPVFKRAVEAREGGRAPARTVDMEELARLAYDELYARINKPSQAPAMEKVRIDAARWVLGQYFPPRKTGGLREVAEASKEAVSDQKDLGLSWMPQERDEVGEMEAQDKEAG